MKVKALTNVKYGADWHFSGEVFEIHKDALSGLEGLVEKADETASPQEPDMNLMGDENVSQEEKPKRTSTRRRKE